MNSKLILTSTVLVGILTQIGAYFISASQKNDSIILITTLLILTGGIILPFINKLRHIGIGLLICSGLNLSIVIIVLILLSRLH